MRALLAVALVLAASCGSRALDGSGAPEARTSPTPADRGGSTATLPLPPLPPDTSDLQGCLAHGFEGYQDLVTLIDRADLIVHAKILRSETTTEQWGPGYRTTLEVMDTLKGRTGGTVEVMESACPTLHQAKTAEWMLFLGARLDAPGYVVPGISHGAFPVRGDRLSRPTYREALLPRRYEGYALGKFLDDVRAIRPLDGDAKAAFAAAGWRVVGTQRIGGFPVPPVAQFGESSLPPRFERPFTGYADVAARTGLDLRPYAGTDVEDVILYLESLPASGARMWSGHALFVDRRLIASYVQAFPSFQSFATADRAAALAAPNASPAPTATPNRYPNAVNVVREYGLAAATYAYVKGQPPVASGVGMGGTRDPVKIAELVAALDATLPTVAAPSDQTNRYWAFGFQLGEQYLIFEYFPDLGLLGQRDDGFAIRPGPSLRGLLEALGT